MNKKQQLLETIDAFVNQRPGLDPRDYGGGIDGWHIALQKLSESNFLTGQNDNGWKADFDFILQEKSFTKLMEGSYDNRKGKENAKSKLARETEELLDEIRSRPDSEDVIHPDKRSENIRQRLLCE